MKPWAQFLAHGVRTFFAGISTLALWTVWLGLALLLALQLYVLSAHELAVPEFALRKLEARLAESGLRATFSRTSFDPTGRVLMENVRLSLPAFSEPVATAGSVYVHLNPLALIVGRVEPSEIRLVRVAASVPAILSPSGRTEPVIQGLEATIEPAGRTFVVRQLNARVFGVNLTARGIVPLPRSTGKPSGDSLATFLGRRFPDLCKQALAANDFLAQLDQPHVQIDFAPSESGLLGVNVNVLARAIDATQPYAVKTGAVQASTRLLLFGDAPPTHVELVASEIRLPGETTLRGVNAIVYGRFRTGSAQFDLREVAVTLDSITAAGADARAVSAQIFPRPLPRLTATVTGNFLGSPLALRAETDLGERSAVVRFEGAISPRVLDVLSQRLRLEVRKYYDFESLTAERAEARFGAGWKFEKLQARVHVPRMNSYGVVMEDGRAVVELEPHRFYAPEAYARIGENFARGSYEHDLRTHHYRFLLEGRLRPMAIAGWFGAWWPNFFRQLEFPAAPPDASVDVRGMWRSAGQSAVFVFADAGPSILRGTEFDRVRTRLFIRPAFFEGLDILAARGEADAHGRFTFRSDPLTHEWHSLELGLNSSLDLGVAAQLFGPAGAKALAPFKLAAAPRVKVRGSFIGPAGPKGTNDKLRIEARTTGDFHYQGFPLQDASFIATLDGEELVLDDFEAIFADGVVGGHARVWGTGAQRRLGFDVSLRDATLGQVAGKMAGFFAAHKGQPAPPPGKFVKEKASVKVDFAASAEGRYTDLYSFRGEGNVALQGTEIGEVPLLGQLSELLKFTALRFTDARGNFKIEGAKLVFSKVELRGANSAIDAHGDYALDKRTLDFSAKIFPFQESESLLKSVVGAVLTPLSNAFEVKLTGSIAKPEWAFTRGPTNFLRALADGGESSGKSASSADPNPSTASKP